MKKEEALQGVRLFVVDLDGTVYIGDHLIRGAAVFLSRVENDPDRDYVFFTNNTSKAPEVYVSKLAGMGLDVPEEKIITAGDVCAAYIMKRYPGACVYLNGTMILAESWRKKGIRLMGDADSPRDGAAGKDAAEFIGITEIPDVAVQSFDTSLTYRKLDRICHYVRNGVPFLATHMDINCPTEYGYAPDCGAMCALITASTGVSPRYFGKPFPETVEMITEMTGYAAYEMAFIGDRVYTDVAAGVNNGAKGFLVLTGESDMRTVAESAVAPTCIFQSLGEMAEYL